MSNYFSTEQEWVKTETYGKWVCKYCKHKTQTKYIATGHDHTDYDYKLCDCLGAKLTGVAEEDCK